MNLERNEIIKLISVFYNINVSEVKISPCNFENSLTSQVENGEDNSVFSVLLTDKEHIIAKLKSADYVENVGKLMNYFDSQKFQNKYKKGYRIFYIEDAFERERFIYPELNVQFTEHIPKYYGSIMASDDTCIYLLEKININTNIPKPEEIVDFLLPFHFRYLNDYGAALKMKVNIHDLIDYKNAIGVSNILFDTILSLYHDIDKYVIKELKEFANNPSEIFQTLLAFPRTICHGDFSTRNLSVENGIIKVFDWELATFNNPMFDIVSYLVDYPGILSKSYTIEILECYMNEWIKKGINLEKREWMKSFTFNIKLFFVTRFHAAMVIAKRIYLPYMKDSIKNYFFLYNMFCKETQEYDNNI